MNEPYSTLKTLYLHRVCQLLEKKTHCNQHVRVLVMCHFSFQFCVFFLLLFFAFRWQHLQSFWEVGKCCVRIRNWFSKMWQWQSVSMLICNIILSEKRLYCDSIELAFSINAREIIWNMCCLVSRDSMIYLLASTRDKIRTTVVASSWNMKLCSCAKSFNWNA